VVRDEVWRQGARGDEEVTPFERHGVFVYSDGRSSQAPGRDTSRKENVVKIEERIVGSVVVLDMAGRLVAGESQGRLKDKINSLTMQGRHQVLLNLAEVSYIDSTGLGELVASYSTVTRNKGQIKLLNLTTRVQDLLTICRLSTVFETYESEADALRSFSAVSTV
jgi:anti-sigma B factor antagonist